MERDRQALWRTCVQVVAGVVIAACMLFAWFSNVIWAEFFPEASADASDAWTLGALALAAGCSAAYWASLRRLRPEPD